jgi:hypothetical protein
MAEAGSNSEDMKALYFTHFNAIEAQKAIVKEAQAELKALRKKAKGDGCVMADLDYMARCANLDDPEIVPSELLRRTQIAAWFVLPVNYQPDMFEDRAPIDDRAFKEGEKHAMTNGDPVSPYGENSKAGPTVDGGLARGSGEDAQGHAGGHGSEKRRQGRGDP